jgi:hypothetical protein
MDERTHYHDDFYGWSQDQAEVLRSMRDRPGLPNGLDLEHVIEEIEGVGSSQLSAVESFLRLILVHLIKAGSSANPEVRGHWREETLGFHADLLARYSPSMRRALDLDLVWRRALRQAEAALEEYGEAVAPGLKGSCPLALEDLLREELDLPGLLSRVTADREASGS